MPNNPPFAFHGVTTFIDLDKPLSLPKLETPHRAVSILFSASIGKLLVDYANAVFDNSLDENSLCPFIQSLTRVLSIVHCTQRIGRTGESCIGVLFGAPAYLETEGHSGPKLPINSFYLTYQSYSNS